VLVEIASDQDGCFEDSRPTTRADPTYRAHSSLFYCVANLPGAVPHTSTCVLTNVTLLYAVELADRGCRDACRPTSRLSWPGTPGVGLPQKAEGSGRHRRTRAPLLPR